MAKLEIYAAPAGTLLDNADLSMHARIDHDDEDLYLQQIIDVAQAAAEDFTWRKFVTQTWDQYFDDFADPLHLQYAPVQSVSSITYTDDNGDSQTLSTDIYELAEEQGLPLVRRKYNQTWPTARDHADVVKVRYVCGYASLSAVPERIKQAVRVYATWLFEERDGQPVPAAFFNLLRPLSLARPKAIGAA